MRVPAGGVLKSLPGPEGFTWSDVERREDHVGEVAPHPAVYTTPDAEVAGDIRADAAMDGLGALVERD